MSSSSLRRLEEGIAGVVVVVVVLVVLKKSVWTRETETASKSAYASSSNRTYHTLILGLVAVLTTSSLVASERGAILLSLNWETRSSRSIQREERERMLAYTIYGL